MNKLVKSGTYKGLKFFQAIVLLFVLIGIGSTPAFAAFSQENYATMQNPAYPGEIVTSWGDYYGDNYNLDISIKNVMRGSEAENYALSINQFNEIPSGAELFIFDVELTLNSYDDAPLYVSDYDFTGYTSSKGEYSNTTSIVLDDDLGGYVYEGGTIEGKAYIFAPYGDSPYIAYNPFYSPEHSVFFKADPYLPELSITSFSTGGKTEFSVGEQVTLSAQATGGNTRLSSHFYAFDSTNPDGSTTDIMNWSTRNTAVWSPTQYGEHTLTAYVVDSGDGFEYVEKVVTVKPKTPTGLKASPSGTSEVTLSWTEDPKASGYTVYRATSVDGPFTSITASGNTHTFSGLTTGVKYYFKVRSFAYAEDYTKIYSSYSSVVTATPILDAPVNLSGVITDAASNRLTWEPVPGAAGYAVYYATSLNGTYTLKLASTTSYRHTGLAANTAYFYKVKAYSLVDGTRVYGAASSSISLLPSPVGYKADPAGYDAISISWTPMTGAAGYQIYRSTSLSGSYNLVLSTSTTPYKHMNLIPGTTYYYKVRAYSLINSVRTYGAFSPVFSAKPALGIPASLKSTGTAYNTAASSWSAVEGASGYQLWRSTSSTGSYILIRTTTSTSFTNTGLAAGTTYYYKVRAYKTVGTSKVFGSYSVPVSVKPILSVPASLTASSSGYDRVKTSWAEVSGATGYELSRSSASTGTYTVVTTTAGSSYTNTGLTAGTTYYYKVRAFTEASGTKVYGGYSEVKSAKPVPGTPADFTAVRVGSTSIKSSWSSVPGSSYYQVYRATSSTGTYSLIKTTSYPTFTDSALTTGKTYYYKVRAYRNVDGTKVYGSYSAAKSARP